MNVRSMKQWSSLVKEALDGTFLVAKFLCLLHVTNTYLCTVAVVGFNSLSLSVGSFSTPPFLNLDVLQTYGPSMLPTLSLTGDLVLAERITPRLGKVGIGDVVLVRSPENPRKVVTKRVVGVEGDRVTYFVDPKNSDRCQTILVPKGHIWIEGDNIYASRDSRNFGAVPYGLLHGKLFWRVWPPKDFGPLGK